MSTTMERYFVSEEQQKSKNWDMLVQYNEAKARLARDENELQVFVAEWDRFASEFRNHRDKGFKFGADEITVFAKRSAGELKPRKIGSLSLKALNEDALKRLWADIKESRKLVAVLGKQLRELGVSLHP